MMNRLLNLVAEFDHQVTGVTVANTTNGLRIFVNFPRWTEDSPISVAEVFSDGSIAPYPNNKWNSWRNTLKDKLDPKKHFVCVQSVLVGPGNYLWVLDPAAPAQSFIVKNGPKLVQIDLETDKVITVIPFNEKIAPQGSYLNDIRFSPDGQYAYITDSGVKGAIGVVDLYREIAVRALDGHPSTQVDKAIEVEANGKVLRRPDGRGIDFSADGIAISKDGQTLYWQAIRGKTLYSVSTGWLQNQLIKKDSNSPVKKVGINGVADGLLIVEPNLMIITSPEDDSLKVRDLNHKADNVETLITDPRLRWPDTLTQDTETGTIYVTTSRIQDSAFFKPTAPKALKTQLWAFSW
jgi:sugar lactone lactonase YvrE